MRPKTLQTLIAEGRYNASRGLSNPMNTNAFQYDMESIKDHLSILLNFNSAPYIVAAYSRNRIAKWYPLAGDKAKNPEVVATLYYLYDKDAHNDPQPSTAGKCTMARVNVLMGQGWPTEGPSRLQCKDRVR